MNIAAFSRVRFTSQQPEYLVRAAESFRRRLVERNIPTESLDVYGGRIEGLPMIEIKVPTETLKEKVLEELHQFQGAIPMGDNRHVNFKVARVRVTVQQNAFFD